jgi:hypothetical protein
MKMKVGELKQSEYKPQDKRNEFGRVMAKRSIGLIIINSIEVKNDRFKIGYFYLVLITFNTC